MESLRRYWRRMRYERLELSDGPQKKNRIELGRSRRKQRFWRFRIRPKIRLFRLSSPKMLLLRLRDAYVRMMLGFASSTTAGAGPRATGFCRPSLKEYDEKAIVETYKSLMAHQRLMDGRNGGSKIAPALCYR